VPANPGVYLLGNIPATQRGQREAEHKVLVEQFQTWVGAIKGLKDLNLQAVDKDFLLELQAKGIAYLNVTPVQMLTHLHDCWGTLDFIDITALLSECNTPWNAVEVPTKYFNWTHKARRQLARANIQIDEQAMMVKALKSYKDAGDFDATICEWEARPVAMQTYANLKVVMCAEFSKLNQQDSTTARATGHSSANNVMEEMAQVTTELVTELTKCHTQEIKSLIKSNNDTMDKLIAAISASNKPPAATGTNGATSSRLKVAVWAEKRRTATTCPHCNCIHPNCTRNQCWELPANAAKRHANWKSVKST
jgi:hypothetical protein